MSDFQFVCSADEISEGEIRVVELDDRIVLLARCGDDFFCMDDVCTHDGGTLSDGQLAGCEIECPRHGAKFDLRTGAALTMPATVDNRTHQVRVESGRVFIQLSTD